MKQKMKEKLIVTLWRAHIDSASQYQSVFCRMSYNSQVNTTKTIEASKSLTWKETFVFPLSRTTGNLQLDFINMHEIQEIHYAKDQVLDGLGIGRSEVTIDLDNSNRGTVPAKVHIYNEGKNVGSVFLEYEILKTEVTYVVEKLIDYEYVLKIKSFKLSFQRNLPTVPSFFFKFTFGDRVQKEDFSLEEQNGIFTYNFPVQFYLKNEKEMGIDIQIKEHYKKDYRNPNISFDSESVSASVHSNNLSTISNKKGNKKSLIEIESINKLSTVLELGFKRDGIYSKKLSVNMIIKNSAREIGFLEFDAEVIFRTKREKEEYEIQKQREIQTKNANVEAAKKKKQRRYELPKNGEIIVNSIIGKLELFSQDLIKDKDVSIELKLGKISQNSAVIDNPGRQIIWMDTFTFKRTWQEIIKFTVYVHQAQNKTPKLYASINLRQLFEVGRYMAMKLQLKDDAKNYCGFLVVDIIYKEEEEKPKQIITKKSVEILPEEKERLEKQVKKQLIMERMKLREQAKNKREMGSDSTIPIFSENQLILPPLRSSRNLKRQNATISPRIPQNISVSVNVYNNGGAQYFSKSPRFLSSKKNYDADSFIYRPESDFEVRLKRGASIGYGDKYDFTKQYERAPGVGRYQIPSVWDKYK